MMVFLRHIWEGFSIAYMALKANPVRSTLTTLGIIIGVLTVILMITIVQGLNQSFKGQLSFLGSGVLYVNRSPWVVMDEFYRYRNRPNVSIDDYRAVRDNATLTSAVAMEMATGKSVKFEERSLSRVEINGVSANYIEVVSTYPRYGRFLNEIDVAHNRPVAVIGSEVARELFDKVNPLGRRISISGSKFRVIGVLEEQGKFLGMSLDTKVIIPYGAFTKEFGRRHWVSIIAKAKDPKQMENLEYELKGIIRRERGLRADEEDNFSINQQSMLMNLYNQVTSGVYAVGLAIGAISLLVGGIGIMNIMMVSVTERTREIGIRKAIGAKKLNIVWQFLVESAAICALGGTIGVAGAFGLAKIIDTWLPTAMSVWVAVFGVGFAAAVGIFFGLWPAVKAAKLNPIEALRYE